MALNFSHGSIQWLASAAATTTYTVSGLSFQPKAIRFYVLGSYSATDLATDTTHSRRSVGFAVSTSSRRCVGSYETDGAGSMACASFLRDDCAAAIVNASAASSGRLDLNSIASDGFQMIVDEQATTDVMVFWEAWGGDDITVAAIGDIAEPGATGNQDYTVTGFTSTGTDQVVMFAGVQSTAAANTGQVESSGLSVGFASSGTAADNACVVGSQDHSVANADTDGWGGDELCHAMIPLAGGNATCRAALTQWNTDGFRLNWAAVALTDRRSIFLAIKGGKWKAGGSTINVTTAANTATVSSLAFAPQGVLLVTRCLAENTATATSSIEDRVILGTATGTRSRRSMGHWSEDGTGNAEIDLAIEYDQAAVVPSNAGGVLVKLDLNRLTADGFTLVVDTADAGGSSAAWWGYLAFASVTSTDLPRAGLTLDCDASTTSYVYTTLDGTNGEHSGTPGNGDEVQIWEDGHGSIADVCLTWRTASSESPNFRSGASALMKSGLTELDFNGTDYLAAYGQLGSGTKAISNFLTASAWTAFGAFYAESVTTNTANIYQNHGLLADASGFWGIFLRDNSGTIELLAYQWDGASKHVAITVSTSQTWVWYARYDGTDLRIAVNNGSGWTAEQTATAGNLTTMTGQLWVASGSSNTFNGRKGQFSLYNVNKTGTDLTALKDFYADKWVPAAAGAMTGTAALTITPTGALTGAGALAGTAALVFGAGSTVLTGAGALAGVSALVLGEGTTTLTGAGALAGAAALVFGEGSSTLLGAGALAGAVDLTIGAGSSTLAGAGALAGVCALTITGSATANVPSGELAGTAALTLTPTATLSGAGALAGVAALAFTNAGVASGAGALAGAADLTLTPTATLLGAGALAGSAPLVLTGEAVATGVGALAGTSILVLIGSATAVPPAGFKAAWAVGSNVIITPGVI